MKCPVPSLGRLPTLGRQAAHFEETHRPLTGDLAAHFEETVRPLWGDSNGYPEAEFTRRSQKHVSFAKLLDKIYILL